MLSDSWRVNSLVPSPWKHRAGFFSRLLALGVVVCTSISAALGTTVEGTVTVDGHPAVDAVVFLEGSGAAPPPPAAPVVMDQKNLAFVPDVLPVMRGSVVEFTNSDDVQHNVFTPSDSAGKFNLGTYGPGAVRTVTLNKSGDVRVLCNIHMEMEAHILVLDGPYFATTTADGKYQISAVPAGRYVLKVWQEHWRAPTQSIEAPAAGNLTVNAVVGK